MVKIYLLILGFSLIVHTIYVRFILTRIPFAIDNISHIRALTYSYLAIIFACILLSIYYHFFRTYVLKKPINENSWFFKIKLFFNEIMEKYGPETALKTFFMFFSKVVPLSYSSIVWFFMRFLTENKFAKYKYYYEFVFLIFVGLPRFIVATMFLIDVCYYEHVALFYKWSLLLALPLIFNTILGILKFYYDSNIRFYQHAFVVTKTIENDEEKFYIHYSDPEYYKAYVGPISFFLANYFLIRAFIQAYIKLEVVRDKYFLLSIYTMHCYLIGWLYILYFYWL